MSRLRVLFALPRLSITIRAGLILILSSSILAAQAPVSTAQSDRAAVAYPDGTLVRSATSPRIYAVYGGVAHWIATPTVLSLLGFASTPVVVLSATALHALPKGGTFVERPLANGLPYPFSPIRTVKANIYTYPPSAAPSAVVTIEGLGFAARETVQLDLGGAIVFQAQASVSGTMRAAVAVPTSLPLGTYRITALGLQSRAFGIEPFTVIPPNVAPTVAPTPAFTVPGGSFTAAGTGFRPGEAIYLYDAQAYATTGAAGATGAFGPVALLVPGTVTVGIHTLWAFGATSHYLATSTIAVASPAPASLQANPTTLNGGSLVTVAGSNFAPNEHVTLTIGNASEGEVTANEQGNVTGAVITVPPGTPAGQVALTARGVSSGRAASVIVTVVALTPHLLVSPATAGPGTTLTIAGAGFAPGEGVTLALNGAALASTPASITTDAQGNFFASAVVPATVVSGPNSLEAIGTRSHATASTTLAVRLPVAAAWYFAGVDARAGADGRIAVLNPDNNPARLTLHLSSPGAAARDLAVSMGGHSSATIDLAAQTGRRALYFVRLTADRRVGAAETTWRGGRDWSSTTAVAAPERTWYVAEGYTGGSFREYLRIYNPGRATSHVAVQLLPQHGRPRTLHLALAPDTGTEIFVHRHLKGQGVAAIVGANQGIVVDRAMTFGRGDFGASEATGSTGGSTTWLFATGSTNSGYQTSYSVLNPNRHDPAAVTATFLNDRGRPIGSRTIIVAPLHRGTLNANEAVRSGGMSTVLSSNVAVVAERVMYFGGRDRARAGSALPGRNGGSLQWEFPYGNTRGYRESYVLQNTSATAATISIEFYTPNGSAHPATATIPPRGRAVVPVNSVPGLPAGEHGAIVASTNGIPFLAEETLYSGDGKRGDIMAGVAQ